MTGRAARATASGLGRDRVCVFCVCLDVDFGMVQKQGQSAQEKDQRRVVIPALETVITPGFHASDNMQGSSLVSD